MEFLKQRKYLYVFLAVGVALILFWENKKLAVVLESVEKNSESESIKPEETAIQPSTTPLEATAAASANVEKLSPADFESWLKNEASLLDSSIAPNSEKDVLLKEKASRFSDSQVELLTKKAKGSAAPANEKIMATYFLTLASNANAGLQEIAKTPLSLPSPQPVHSVGEAALMQEKAIRVMAIDELFNRLQNDAITRDELQKTISQIPDPFLKQYAQGRWQELL